jgi:hypothetical protein
MMRNRLRSGLGALALMVVAVSAAGPAAAEVNFGKQGEPVNLVVGYQPYYTEAWSGVVMKGKELWKKHLGRLERRISGRPAGRHHRQRDDGREAAHRLRRRHAGDRCDLP